MRSKLCDDGNRRILAKVEVPVGASEISTYVLQHPSFHDVESPINTFESLNKRQLFILAKESIRLFGTMRGDPSHSFVWPDNHIRRAKKHVKTMFPEVD